MDMGRNGYRRKVKETEEDNSEDFAILLEIRGQFVDGIGNGLKSLENCPQLVICTTRIIVSFTIIISNNLRPKRFL